MAERAMEKSREKVTGNATVGIWVIRYGQGNLSSKVAFELLNFLLLKEVGEGAIWLFGKRTLKAERAANAKALEGEV